MMFTIIRIIAAAMLFWGASSIPTGEYYILMRLVTSTAGFYGGCLALQWKRIGWAVPYGAMVVLFFPLITVRMTRHTWAYIDVATATFLVVTVFLFHEKKRPMSEQQFQLPPERK